MVGLARVLYKQGHMSRRIALVLTLLPTLAFAQAITLREANETTTTTWTFGKSYCTSTSVIPVQWTYNPAVALQICSGLRLWVSSGTCTETMGTNDLALPQPLLPVSAVNRTGTVDVPVPKMPGFSTTSADGGVNTNTCGADGILVTHHVCGVIGTLAGVGCTNQIADSLTLVYDTQAPTAPTIVSATAEDSAASVTFSVDADATTVFAEVKGPGASDFSGAGSVSASTKVIRVPNLSNGETWSIRLHAEDAAGNPSLPSDAVNVVPVQTIGFFGVYRQQGGTDQGGCSAAGAAFPLAALLLGGAFVRRRSRRS